VTRICRARFLGRVAYAEAARLQERAVRGLMEGRSGEELLLLEHPHVVTLGRGADRTHCLLDEATRAARGIGIYETGRGGDVTYHGPGQLVGYPVLDLSPDRRDAHRYVRDLEEVLIRTAADFGVRGGRVRGLTGVWVGGRKLAAIGVRISRWITSHGFALNVTTDLSYFSHIVPCGIAGAQVTSLLEETGREISLEEVAASAAHHLGRVFGRRILGFGRPEESAGLPDAAGERASAHAAVSSTQSSGGVEAAEAACDSARAAASSSRSTTGAEALPSGGGA
jgi:lipoyl(octanoyl) transferase